MTSKMNGNAEAGIPESPVVVLHDIFSDFYFCRCFVKWTIVLNYKSGQCFFCGSCGHRIKPNVDGWRKDAILGTRSGCRPVILLDNIHQRRTKSSVSSHNPNRGLHDTSRSQCQSPLNHSSFNVSSGQVAKKRKSESWNWVFTAPESSRARQGGLSGQCMQPVSYAPSEVRTLPGKGKSRRRGGMSERGAKETVYKKKRSQYYCGAMQSVILTKNDVCKSPPLKLSCSERSSQVTGERCTRKSTPERSIRRTVDKNSCILETNGRRARSCSTGKTRGTPNKNSFVSPYEPKPTRSGSSKRTANAPSSVSERRTRSASCTVSERQTRSARRKTPDKNSFVSPYEPKPTRSGSSVRTANAPSSVSERRTRSASCNVSERQTRSARRKTPVKNSFVSPYEPKPTRSGSSERTANAPSSVSERQTRSASCNVSERQTRSARRKTPDKNSFVSPYEPKPTRSGSSVRTANAPSSVSERQTRSARRKTPDKNSFVSPYEPKPTRSGSSERTANAPSSVSERRTRSARRKTPDKNSFVSPYEPKPTRSGSSERTANAPSSVSERRTRSACRKTPDKNSFVLPYEPKPTRSGNSERTANAPSSGSESKERRRRSRSGIGGAPDKNPGSSQSQRGQKRDCSITNSGGTPAKTSRPSPADERYFRKAKDTFRRGGNVSDAAEISRSQSSSSVRSTHSLRQSVKPTQCSCCQQVLERSDRSRSCSKTPLKPACHKSVQLRRSLSRASSVESARSSSHAASMQPLQSPNVTCRSRARSPSIARIRTSKRKRGRSRKKRCRALQGDCPRESQNLSRGRSGSSAKGAVPLCSSESGPEAKVVQCRTCGDTYQSRGGRNIICSKCYQERKFLEKSPVRSITPSSMKAIHRKSRSVIPNASEGERNSGKVKGVLISLENNNDKNSHDQAKETEHDEENFTEASQNNPDFFGQEDSQRTVRQSSISQNSGNKDTEENEQELQESAANIFDGTHNNNTLVNTEILEEGGRKEVSDQNVSPSLENVTKAHLESSDVEEGEKISETAETNSEEQVRSGGSSQNVVDRSHNDVIEISPQNFCPQNQGSVMSVSPSCEDDNDVAVMYDSNFEHERSNRMNQSDLVWTANTHTVPIFSPVTEYNRKAPTSLIQTGTTSGYDHLGQCSQEKARSLPPDENSTQCVDMYKCKTCKKLRSFIPVPGHADVPEPAEPIVEPESCTLQSGNDPEQIQLAERTRTYVDYESRVTDGNDPEQIQLAERTRTYVDYESRVTDNGVHVTQKRLQISASVCVERNVVRSASAANLHRERNVARSASAVNLHHGQSVRYSSAARFVQDPVLLCEAQLGPRQETGGYAEPAGADWQHQRPQHYYQQQHQQQHHCQQQHHYQQQQEQQQYHQQPQQQQCHYQHPQQQQYHYLHPQQQQYHYLHPQQQQYHYLHPQQQQYHYQQPQKHYQPPSQQEVHHSFQQHPYPHHSLHQDQQLNRPFSVIRVKRGAVLRII